MALRNKAEIGIGKRGLFQLSGGVVAAGNLKPGRLMRSDLGLLIVLKGLPV